MILALLFGLVTISQQTQVELILDGEIENDAPEFAMYGDSFLDDSAFIGINNNLKEVQKVDSNKKILNKSKLT